MTAAIEPDSPALNPVTRPVSNNIELVGCDPASLACTFSCKSSPSRLVLRAVEVPEPFRARQDHNLPLKYSNIGNCIAVNGRFRAASAVYPLHRRLSAPPSLLLSIRHAWRDVDPPCAVPERLAICALDLITSAGVRTRHDASSAVPDAAE